MRPTYSVGFPYGWCDGSSGKVLRMHGAAPSARAIDAAAAAAGCKTVKVQYFSGKGA